MLGPALKAITGEDFASPDGLGKYIRRKDVKAPVPTEKNPKFDAKAEAQARAGKGKKGRGKKKRLGN